MIDEDPKKPSSISPRCADAHTAWDDAVSPSIGIIEAVAAATAQHPTDLPPLQRHIDTDTLDSLLRTGGSGVVRISFRYDTVEIMAASDGALVVRPLD